MVDEQLGEGQICELTSLIGVEDLRRVSVDDCLLDSVMQNSVSIEIDARQASTRRLNHSINAAR